MACVFPVMSWAFFFCAKSEGINVISLFFHTFCASSFFPSAFYSLLLEEKYVCFVATYSSAFGFVGGAVEKPEELSPSLFFVMFAYLFYPQTRIQNCTQQFFSLASLSACLLRFLLVLLSCLPVFVQWMLYMSGMTNVKLPTEKRNLKATKTQTHADKQAGDSKKPKSEKGKKRQRDGSSSAKRVSPFPSPNDTMRQFHEQSFFFDSIIYVMELDTRAISLANGYTLHHVYNKNIYALSSWLWWWRFQVVLCGVVSISLWKKDKGEKNGKAEVSFDTRWHVISGIISFLFWNAYSCIPSHHPAHWRYYSHESIVALFVQRHSRVGRISFWH